MKQEELAGILFVSVTTISRYENNHCEPCDDTKVRIASALNITLDYLLGVHDLAHALVKPDTIMLPSDFPNEAAKIITEYANLVGREHRNTKKGNRQKHTARTGGLAANK